MRTIGSSDLTPSFEHRNNKFGLGLKFRTFKAACFLMRVGSVGIWELAPSRFKEVHLGLKDYGKWWGHTFH